jgi:hypothetical protein
MKKLHLFAAIAVAASLSACGGGETKKAGKDNDPKSKSPGKEAPAVNKGDAVNDTKEVTKGNETEAVAKMATEAAMEVTEKATEAMQDVAIEALEAAPEDL